MRRPAALEPMLVLVLALAVASAAGPRQDRPAPTPFAYAHPTDGMLVERVEMERRAAREAGDQADAERWAVTLALLLEVSRGASDAIGRAAALDAALEELVHARSPALIRRLTPERRRSLHAALAGFDADDPAGLRGYTRGLTTRRLEVLEERVLGAEDPNAGLDELLALHGWRAAGGVGPMGRQRARDRADFRAVDRHAVFELEGMTRWHMLLPPTEALRGVPLEELDRKWQRARNLAAHVDRLWAHQDGPRMHDFLLDLALRDATGVVRLVHADTQRLAHDDRMRRWRLREALWRLSHD